MKIFRIVRIMSAFLILIGVSSCDKEDDPISPEIKLSKSEIILEVGQGECIFISGGDGKTYSISPGTTTNIAEVNLNGNTLEITARQAGVQTFIISSADKKAALKVTVNPRPVPSLGNIVGVYGENGQPVFSYKMTAKTKNGLWLCERASNPYRKRIFLSSYMEGSSWLLIIAEGLSPSIQDTGDQGKKLNITKEKDLEGGKVQLVSGNLRFIVEKK